MMTLHKRQDIIAEKENIKKRYDRLITKLKEIPERSL